MSSLRASLGSDRFLSRLSAAMFLGGVIASMVAGFYSTDYPAIRPLPVPEGSSFGMPIGIVLLALVVVVVPFAVNTFTTARVMAVLSALVFLPMGGAALRTIGNIEFAKGEARAVAGIVTHKRDASGWKVHSYLLHVHSDSSGENFQLSVPYAVFGRVSVGDPITIQVADGFFGQPWVQRIEVPYGQ